MQMSTTWLLVFRSPPPPSQASCFCFVKRSLAMNIINGAAGTWGKVNSLPNTT